MFDTVIEEQRRSCFFRSRSRTLPKVLHRSVSRQRRGRVQRRRGDRNAAASARVRRLAFAASVAIAAACSQNPGVIAASISSSAPNSEGLVRPATAEAIQREIERNGAAAALNELYSDPEAWVSALGGIATGTPAWLRVAELLRPASDAGASEQLELAVGEALGSSPDIVLSWLVTQQGANHYEVPFVCGGIDVDDDRFNGLDLALAEVNRRIRAVEKVADPRLQSVREQCLSKLRESPGHLRRFFRPE